MKKFFYILVVLCFIGCDGPEARRPIKVKTGSYFKQSIARNKALLAKEEKLIAHIIKGDTVHNYTHSPNGSWFYYDVKNEEETYLPESEDLVTMTYNLVDFNNDTIYSMEEIGVFKYKVDKQDLFLGLRTSVKLLKVNETATFLYPSSLGYGYHGDNKKIGTNIPLKATVSIFNIEKNKDSIQN
ncbi:gliding motility-associated peptidyl-prolyl isomerase GldI [Cellulophaga sp. F20128]|uniref:gliding motility-associated peptidyl-prolyl isomerase GldI n=1 Tax=Cellulophaga sp. F20128 TaxID=2926413 RepID=UPI001FF29EB6|nr:gliding motility-associated peptidyl-prolyl isomerase GldI [Cellulophaga sp. F20128]MCK0157625.1 gliding motility-associated peptidyl-prolyl isomerase GldI [Cellulophaga sp. F20128]